MAGIPAEDFCLKWNDHHSIFFSSVERLCELDTLTDVTISCGTRDFTAHKLVLSVCSGYFARLFGGKRTMGVPDIRSAIVYLKDVNPRHMELLLNYMYRGEINVQESELVGLLETARSLQIKGLADNAEPSGGTTPNDTSVPAKKPPKSKVGLPTMSQLPKLTQKRPMTTNSDVINTETSPTTKKIKEESSWSTGTANSSADPESPIEEITNHDEGNTNEDYLAEEEYAYEEEYAGMDPESNDNSNFGSNSGDGQNLGASTSEYGNILLFGYQTPVQPHKKPSVSSPSVVNSSSNAVVGGTMDSPSRTSQPLGVVGAAGAALGQVPFACSFCGKSFPSRYKLDRHERIHTGIKPFVCTICGHASSDKDNLRNHCKSQHGGLGLE